MTTKPRMHIPYKFYREQRNQSVHGAVTRFLSPTDDAVTARQLEDVLNDVLKGQSEDHRQNWLEIERWAAALQFPPSGLSMFDAVIDPGFPTDAGSHHYINLTALLANESWTSTHVFTVGVVNRPGTPVTETGGSPTIPGPLALVAFGGATPGWYVGLGNVASRCDWDFNGTRFIGGGTIYLYGMRLYNAGATTFDFFRSAQSMQLRDCVVQCFDDSNVRKISVVSDGGVTALNTAFQGTVFSGRVNATDCHYTWANDNSTVTLFADHTIWDGGTLAGVFGSTGTVLTLNNSSAKDVYVRFVRCTTTQITGSSGGAVLTLNVNAGGVTLDMPGEGTGVPTDLTVQVDAGDIDVRGAFRHVTDSGQTNPQRRKYDISSSGIVDIKGPATVKVQYDLAGTGGRMILRGPRIQAQANGRIDATGTFLTLTGADDCYVVATATGNAGTSQFYAIDAGSDRSIVIVTGLNTGAWGAASTNASGTTIVRDETTL